MSSAVFLAGCQFGQIGSIIGGSAGSSAPSVIELWGTYKHCRSAVEPQVTEADARWLTVGAQRAIELDPSPILLPAFFKQHVVEPAPRFSVDPKAMSASCSLHAGHTALKAGQPALAGEMFQLVLRNHAQSHYRYYVDRAREGLRQADSGILASQPTQPDPIPILYPGLYPGTRAETPSPSLPTSPSVD